MDGYNDDRTSQTFTFGRVVGSICLCSPDQPVHFLAARALPATPGVQPQMGTEYAMIDGDSLLVDLGNSIPAQSAGGPLVTNLGRLYAVALPADGPVLLREIEYQVPNWYSQTAGITTLKLTAEQLKVAENAPLAIAQSSIIQQPPALAPPPLLSEAGNGAFLRADQFVFRLNPGDKATTKALRYKFRAEISQPADQHGL